MTTPDKPLVNVADVPLFEFGHGEVFAAKVGRIGPMIGAKGLGCTLTVVAPGKRAFPFHAHHANEEMFVVLEGTGEYRLGDRRFPIRQGDVLSAPAGDAGTAHQIINTGSGELRYLAFSTMHQPEVVEYPDSRKFAVLSRMSPGGGLSSAGLRFVGRAAESLDYWDGEGEPARPSTIQEQDNA